jgi:hypothetical protein
MYSNILLVCDVYCTNNGNGIAFTTQCNHDGMNMFDNEKFIIVG